MPKKPRLAVLIDAENVSAKYIGPLFEEVTKLGTSTAKRIYGDWTQPDSAKWRNLLSQYAIIPVQQFRLSTGKNCIDCALIIDAMDLLYSGQFDGFCIVSSDSDFTRLACRLRESGLVVYGFGERKTPEAFVKSCDRFITLERLEPLPEPTQAMLCEDVAATERDKKTASEIKNQHSKGPGTQAAKKKTADSTKKDPTLPTNGAATPSRLIPDKNQVELIESAYRVTAGADGWATLGLFGAQLFRLPESVHPRAFGRSKLGKFVESIDLFEIKKQPHPKNPSSLIWHIKWKSRSPSHPEALDLLSPEEVDTGN